MVGCTLKKSSCYGYILNGIFQHLPHCISQRVEFDREHNIQLPSEYKMAIMVNRRHAYISFSSAFDTKRRDMFYFILFLHIFVGFILHWFYLVCIIYILLIWWGIYKQ